MQGELRMVRMRFEVPRLFELGKRRRLPLREADVGYLVHCATKELFGVDAPIPFSIGDARGRHVAVLAYTQRSRDELEAHARTFADPGVFATCDFTPEVFAEKRMPGEWKQGTRLGFEVRACPIVRMSSDGPRWRKGAEVDSFLARCWKMEREPVERGNVYREWLERELGRGGAARLARFELRAFKRDKVVRRDHGAERQSHVAERPDATLAGDLMVADGHAFAALLARGIGRHRSFGFGMLLLRPPRPC